MGIRSVGFALLTGITIVAAGCLTPRPVRPPEWLYGNWRHDFVDQSGVSRSIWYEMTPGQIRVLYSGSPPEKAITYTDFGGAIVEGRTDAVFVVRQCGIHCDDGGMIGRFTRVDGDHFVLINHLRDDEANARTRTFYRVETIE